MKVVFYASVGKKFDDAIAAAFGAGCKNRGVDFEIAKTSEWAGRAGKRTDMAVVVGVKDKSGPIFKAHRHAGKHAVFIDKGYTRIRGSDLGTLYWRVSVDAFQPLTYFLKTDRPSDRWDALGLPILPRQAGGEIVLLAGSSQKFCTWHDLGEATAYYRKTLVELSKHTKRELVYRPKPSWQDAVPIKGFGYSPPAAKYEVELERSHCLVTYGSNACFEALIRGVPTLILGDGITRPLASTGCHNVERPFFPNADAVRRLAHNLAYCQWTLQEMECGKTWDNIVEVMTKP